MPDQSVPEKRWFRYRVTTASMVAEGAKLATDYEDARRQIDDDNRNRGWLDYPMSLLRPHLQVEEISISECRGEWVTISARRQ